MSLYLAGGTTTLLDQQTIPLVIDGTDGNNGLNAATVFLYQRATSAPSVPSSSLTYTFSTGALSPSSSLGSWSQTIPAINGNPCWQTQATAISSDSTYTISSSKWSSPVKIVEDGSNGISVISNVPIWYASSSDSTPEKPTSAVTSTSTSGGAWRVVLPELTTSYPYLYTCNQVAYSNGTYTWSTVVYDRANAAIVNLEDRVSTA